MRPAKTFTFFLILLTFNFALLTFTPPAFAQFIDWESSGCVEGGVATLQCIPAVFQNVVTAALMLAGVVAVFMIVYSGIRFITSGGDPKAVEAARGTLTWAIIGLVVILLSFAIINFIAFVTGAECIKTFGFSNCQ